MAMRELGILETVRVTEIWPHEERDFTPWMEENLGHINKIVGMDLEVVGREYRTADRGRVDILARDKRSGRMVVIENQIYESDNDHLLRMLGYAAATDAKCIVWVATHFWERHLKVLRWLSEVGVEVFAVTVSAVKIKDSYAPLFEVVVSPEQAADLADISSNSGSNIFGRFYRPLTAELRTEGISAIGGNQGGWAGRWRRYRSGLLSEDTGITFLTTLGMRGEKCSAGFVFLGEKQSNLYEEALSFREVLDESMVGVNVLWEKGENQSHIYTESDSLDGEEEEKLETIRKWMKETLISFQKAFQPKLEEIVKASENQP